MLVLHTMSCGHYFVFTPSYLLTQIIARDDYTLVSSRISRGAQVSQHSCGSVPMPPPPAVWSLPTLQERAQGSWQRPDDSSRALVHEQAFVGHRHIPSPAKALVQQDQHLAHDEKAIRYPQIYLQLGVMSSQRESARLKETSAKFTRKKFEATHTAWVSAGKQPVVDCVCDRQQKTA